MDGCALADDPDNQRCCSTSDPGPGAPNFWRVDFDQSYLIDRVVVIGRSGKKYLFFVHCMETVPYKFCVSHTKINTSE